MQLEGALLLCSCCGRTVRISWPHEREPCVVGKWAAAGMVGGRGWVDWWIGGGRAREGWVGSPFLSRGGVELAKSPAPSHFGLPVTNLNMERLYLCDADSLYSTYINRTKIDNLGSYWRQSTKSTVSTSHTTKLEESLPSRLA